MNTKKMIAVLVITIAVLAAIAAVAGIFSDAGDGPFDSRNHG